jgi:hypothetical protein
LRECAAKFEALDVGSQGYLDWAGASSRSGLIGLSGLGGPRIKLEHTGIEVAESADDDR